MPFITVTYPPKYPLTESEKKWLEERERQSYPATCVRFNKMQNDFDQDDCKGCALHATRYLKGCPLATDYKDAAQFEAKVAIETSRPHNGRHYCPICMYTGYDCSKQRLARKLSHEWCNLKHARLAVEKEMS